MQIDNDTKQTLLRRFPKTELSYCKIINRKVSADYYMAIPKGPKSYLWFTYINNKNVCLWVQLNYQGKIKSLEIKRLCFDKELSYGTLLYGTHVIKEKKLHYICEDILYHKGQSMERSVYEKKLQCLTKIFKNELVNHVPFINTIHVWAPLMSTKSDELKLLLKEQPYSVYGLKYIRKNKSYPIGIERVTIKKTLTAYFLVRATTRDDIYSLYCRDDHYYGSACISSYKKSVFMNSIFRDIKENRNLDLLEESDDDEEFENISEDKFVNLEKIVIMNCVYNVKFKKWEPIEICHSSIDKSAVLHVKNIKDLEKKVL